MDDSYRRWVQDQQSGLDPQTAAALRWKEAMQLRDSADMLIREGGEMLQQAHDRLAGKRYSLVRAINCAADVRGLHDGIEAEMSQECAHQMKGRHDPHKPWIPWEALTQGLSHRVLIAGTATQGGNIVPDQFAPVVNVLFAVSTVVRLGAQVFTGLQGDFAVPRVTASGTAAWGGEVGTAAAADQTVGQIACSPKPIAGYTEYDKRLMLQSAGRVEPMIANNLIGVVGAGLDKAAIAGTGGNQPTGITLTSGITLTTGTAFDHSAAQAMVKASATANVIDENLRALGAPATRELLAKRGINGTAADQFIWQRNAVVDKPAYVSSNVPAATLLVGDFSGLYVLLWGGGIQVETNPYANFTADIRGMKVRAFCDVAVTQPAAWAVSTGIT